MNAWPGVSSAIEDPAPGASAGGSLAAGSIASILNTRSDAGRLRRQGNRSRGPADSIVYGRCVEALVWEGEPPELRAPILVCAFRGWNDAAGSATAALQSVATSLD